MLGRVPRGKHKLSRCMWMAGPGPEPGSLELEAVSRQP